MKKATCTIRDPASGIEIRVPFSHATRMLRAVLTPEEPIYLTPQEKEQRWAHALEMLGDGQHPLALITLTLLRNRGPKGATGRELMQSLGTEDYKILGRHVAAVGRLANEARLPINWLYFRRVTSGVRRYWAGDLVLDSELPPVPMAIT